MQASRLSDRCDHEGPNPSPPTPTPPSPPVDAIVRSAPLRPALALFPREHSQLVQKNLTSSEHHALGKIDYLLAPNHSGQYYNPFDEGCASNFLARVTGAYDKPPPGLLARLDVREGSRSELSHLV